MWDYEWLNVNKKPYNQYAHVSRHSQSCFEIEILISY